MMRAATSVPMAHVLARLVQIGSARCYGAGDAALVQGLGAGDPRVVPQSKERDNHWAV